MTEGNPWRRSTFCESGACIEVAPFRKRRLIGLRESAGQLLLVTPAEFAAFVAGVKAGEFDDLAASDG